MLGYERHFLEKNNGYITAMEINQQPDLWLETIEIIKHNKENIENFIKSINIKETKFILTGAGTSEFIGNTLVPSIRESHDLDIESRATTDIVANPLEYISPTKNIVLVSFARSGNSPESVAAVKISSEVNPNIKHLIFTCNPKGELNQLDLPNSLKILMPEKSNDLGFAMTGSFSCMLLSALLFFNISDTSKIEKEIVKVSNFLKNNLDQFNMTIKELVKLQFNRVVFLGSGELKGLAQEVSLKLLELCAGKFPSFFDTPMGFRHGPKSIVDQNTLIITLLSNNGYSNKYDMDLVSELLNDKKAAMVVTLENSATSANVMLEKHFNINLTDLNIENRIVNSLPYLIWSQIFAFNLSLYNNFTPDNPCPTGEVNRVVKGVKIHKFN